MTKGPKTIEEKIQDLKNHASYIKRIIKIFRGYNPEMERWETYYLYPDGRIIARDATSGKPRYRMSIEEFTKKFGERGLNYVIKRMRSKIRIPENSP